MVIKKMSKRKEQEALEKAKFEKENEKFQREQVRKQNNTGKSDLDYILGCWSNLK